MKKAFTISKLFICISAVLCIMFFAACKSGGSAKKSGVSRSGFLGAIPAIIADNELSKDAAKEKFKKDSEAAVKANKPNKYAKLKEEFEKAEDARDEKYEAELNAEWKKISGKDVPFSVSQEFEKLDLEVSSVKLDAESKAMIITIVPKRDIIVNYKNQSNYKQINVKFFAKDGSVIGSDGFYLVYLGFEQSKTLTKGQPILFSNDKPKSYFRMSKDFDKWADFKNLEFITIDEPRE